ncbi:RICIN domain-containing protein [Brevundimonas lenta]|uniref:Ricin B lectin domain-containing protein n=1 Tax=Brevundimonas lenta TaxID=424796 RepID=A0A7W6JDI8_9CAUL|nr:RICIN domain-containing protein [Brevundimonas lenta]MBB4083137.1 hypothetical protein [Brevundimonas lenta]
MDACNNLTSQDEFANGRRIRFISYLGQGLVIGASGQVVSGPIGIPCMESPSVALSHLSNGNAGNSIFSAQATDGGFTLSRGGDSRQQLSWSAYREPLTLFCNEVTVIAADPVFTVTFVDGCWFTLNNADGSMVVDVAGSGTDEGQPLLGWDPNGGDNQKWRAEVATTVLGRR